MNGAGKPAPAAEVPRSPTSTTQVKHFRQIVLWPVYLMPAGDGAATEDHWAQIAEAGADNPWREVDDEFTGDPLEFQERHYNEFVAFLPPVQRFLYGQGLGKSVHRIYGESPIRVMRRSDIARVRVTLERDNLPLVFEIAHVDLYFFFDIDVAILALEIYASDLSLGVAQDVMFQFGRVYPSYWEPDGRAGHCPCRVEWLSSTGEALSASDYENKQKFLGFVCEHRAPSVAAHWDYLLRPIVLHHADQKGLLRYRQLEYYRMPLAAFLAVEDAKKLTLADYMHLATASGSGGTNRRTAAERNPDDFEAQHCYDASRQLGHGDSGSSVRYWSCGQTLVVTGDAAEPLYLDVESGSLAKFRHQYFVLFLISHFHRASLLMFSDRLAGAVSRLDASDAVAVRAFRLGIRQAFESFLRFTHRYWFHEVSDQPQTQALFDLCRRHLGADRLYSDVRQELQDMSHFLENDAMRRQNETVVRLTVVTIFGLIGTVVTGFLGMNLFALAEESALTRLLIFALITLPTILLTLYTVKKSPRLSEFLDALSDDTLPLRAKWRAFLRVW